MGWLETANPHLDFVAKTCTLSTGECILGQAHESRPAIQLCSLKGLLHTIRAERNVAWLGFLREVKSSPILGETEACKGNSE